MTLPILPLRDIVVFPNVQMPLFVGRAKSVRAVERADGTSRLIFLVAQKDPQVGDPQFEHLHTIGTIARIKQVAKLPDGNLKILVEGQKRGRLSQLISSENRLLLGEVEAIEAQDVPASDTESMLMRTVITSYESFLKTTGKPHDDVSRSLDQIKSPDQLVNVIATQMSFRMSERQELLADLSPLSRLENLASLILREGEVFKIDRKIKSRVREQVEKSQRDYYLNEQLSAIQKELGNDNDPRSEAQDFEKRLSSKKMPEAARQRAQREIKKMKTAGNSPESSVIRTYVELLLDLQAGLFDGNLLT